MRIISAILAMAPRPPAAALARWIRREVATDPPRAPSLIVTVWGDAIAPSRGVVWLSTLFRLLAPFGVNERAVRTGIFRLAKDTWFEAQPVGRRSRYQLMAAGAEGFERAFHRVYDPPFMRWEGHWEVVIVGPAATGAAARKRLRDELAWAGFGRFGSAVYLRPARRDDAAARIARSLRMDDALTAFVARDVAKSPLPSLRSRAAELWELGTLAGEYRRFIARFGGVAAGLKRLRPDPQQAFVLRTLLVHAYRRVRLRDPQLPRAVLPNDWPGADAYELARTLYRITGPRAEAFVVTVLGEDAELAPRKPANPEPRFADPA